MASSLYQVSITKYPLQFGQVQEVQSTLSPIQPLTEMEASEISFVIATTVPSYLKSDQFGLMKMVLVVVKAFPTLLAEPACIDHLPKQHRRSVLAVSRLVVEHLHNRQTSI